MNYKKMEQKTITIIDLINLVKHNKKAYLINFFVTTIFALIIAFSLPVRYTSSIKMIPIISNGNNMDGLSAAASMMGVNLNGMGDNEDPFSIDIYPEIIQSTVFLEKLANTQVRMNDSIKKMPLSCYFLNYQKKPWWSIRLPLLNNKKQDTSIDKNDRFRISEEDEKLYKAIDECINLKVDAGTGEITIDVTMQDPYIATLTADNVCKMLQKHILDYRTNKAKQDLDYYEKLSEQSRIEYLKSMKAYANYADANVDAILMGYKSKESALENEMQIKFNNYSQMEQRKEAAKAKLLAKTPVFNVIQPAYVPLKKSAPRRMILLLMLNMMTISGLTIYYFVKRKLKESL